MDFNLGGGGVDFFIGIRLFLFLFYFIVLVLLLFFWNGNCVGKNR